MSEYSEFFLNSRSSVIMFELFEISHTAFTETFRVVRNATDGLTVTLEDSTQETFDYYPLTINANSARDDLDFGMKINLGDLGEVLPVELDAVRAAGGFDEKPVVKYRVYRSDDLTAPMDGPHVLEVTAFSFTSDGATFDAKAPSLNVNGTGEKYRTNRFPMLKRLM